MNKLVLIAVVALALFGFNAASAQITLDSPFVELGLEEATPDLSKANPLLQLLLDKLEEVRQAIIASSQGTKGVAVVSSVPVDVHVLSLPSDSESGIRNEVIDLVDQPIVFSYGADYWYSSVFQTGQFKTLEVLLNGSLKPYGEPGVVCDFIPRFAPSDPFNWTNPGTGQTRVSIASDQQPGPWQSPQGVVRGLEYQARCYRTGGYNNPQADVTLADLKVLLRSL